MTSVDSRARLLAAALLFAPLLPAAAQAPPVEPARFHHVHLNSVDPQKSVEWYSRHLGAVAVPYRGKTPAVFTERSFLLFSKVAEPPPGAPHSVIQHIGWAGVDGPAEFEWLKAQGVEFQTPLGQLGQNYGFYMFGPDRELVEIWTGGKHHRFDHVHLWASDVAASSRFLRDHLGLEPRIGPKPTLRDRENIAAIWMSFTQADNVNLVFFGRPDFDSVWWPGASYTAADAPREFAPTKGRVIDHIAFSYRDIAPVYERMRAAGVAIAQPIATDPETGITGFFVEAPDRLLIEIVQEKPIPEGIWD